MSAAIVQISSAPSQEEADTAKHASNALDRYVIRGESLKLSVVDADNADCIVLPAEATELLLGILRMMANGHGVALTPIHSELTTGQAAEILNVSRPHLIKLLESGEIPFHKVGQHRRIRREDVMKYQQKFKEARKAFLARLVAESQELGLYD